MLLVTGFPRSGTGYTATLLKLAGVDVGHETVKNDGSVSWLHIAQGKTPWVNVKGDTEWSKIIHIVRNPLNVMSSAQTLTDDAFYYMFRFLGEHPGGERSLRWYMWAWLKWNELIESKAEARFKVEDLSEKDSLRQFIEITGGKIPKKTPPKNVNSRPHKKYTWLDLELADSELCSEIKQKSVKYGYSTFTFGAVMMAKNEAHNLHRCLSSIRPIVDEIILVDTGSEDSTIEIAESYGAKIFHSPWQNNFSLHRNESLGFSTCDFVIQIDCDEELCGDLYALRTAVESVSHSKYNAMALVLKDIVSGRQAMQFNAARIFKRNAVHFEDIVHNRPVFDGDAALPSGESFWLQHYGYDLEKDKKLAKLDRTGGLLRKRIKDNPDDFAAYFYLSQVEGELGNTNEVLKLISHYIENRSKCKKFNRSSFYTHLQALEIIDGIGKKYKKVLHEYMNELPNDLDITFAAVDYASKVKNIKLLRDASERFIKIYKEYSSDTHSQASRFTYTFKPECLATALFFVSTIAFGDAVKALKNYNSVLPHTDDNFRTKAINDMDTACKNLGIAWEYIE